MENFFEESPPEENSWVNYKETHVTAALFPAAHVLLKAEKLKGDQIPLDLTDEDICLFHCGTIFSIFKSKPHPTFTSSSTNKEN
jgi:hypothetical protein